MQKFKKLVVLDRIDMASFAFERLGEYADEVVVYDDFPDEDEVIERVQDADALVLSWKTELTRAQLEKAHNLKYIGLACSFYGNESSNVDAEFCKANNIEVKGIFDYGDPGVIEFILSESIRLVNGYGAYRWKSSVHELAGQNFGIVGLGTTGQLLAKALLALGVNVFYYSRSRKKDWEKKGVCYLSLEELVQKCDLVSVHLPRNTKLFSEPIFEKIGTEKILINTSLGLPFNEDDFIAWMRKKGNYGIFDADGSNSLSESTRHLDRIIIQEQSAGWSEETKNRRAEKVLENLKRFLLKG